MVHRLGAVYRFAELYRAVIAALLADFIAHMQLPGEHPALVGHEGVLEPSPRPGGTIFVPVVRP